MCRSNEISVVAPMFLWHSLRTHFVSMRNSASFRLEVATPRKTAAANSAKADVKFGDNVYVVGILGGRAKQSLGLVRVPVFFLARRGLCGRRPDNCAQDILDSLERVLFVGGNWKFEF